MNGYPTASSAPLKVQKKAARVAAMFSQHRARQALASRTQVLSNAFKKTFRQHSNNLRGSFKCQMSLSNLVAFVQHEADAQTLLANLAPNDPLTRSESRVLRRLCKDVVAAARFRSTLSRDAVVRQHVEGDIRTMLSFVFDRYKFLPDRDDVLCVYHPNFLDALWLKAYLDMRVVYDGDNACIVSIPRWLFAVAEYTRDPLYRAEFNKLRLSDPNWLIIVALRGSISGPCIDVPDQDMFESVISLWSPSLADDFHCLDVVLAAARALD